mgnify:CR=1 FL=1
MIPALILWVLSVPLYMMVEPPERMDPAVLRDLIISYVLMILHKVESYYTNEWDVDPIYTKLSRTKSSLFIVFVGTFLLMNMLVVCLIVDPNWRYFFLSIWGAQLITEIHHVSKAVARNKYYSGAYSGFALALYGCLSFFPNYARMWNIYDISIPVTIFLSVLFYYEAKPSKREYSSIFITGASKGIGAELVKMYARPGCHITICSRTPIEESFPGEVVTHAVDIREDVSKYIREANERKPLDLVIANACTKGSVKDQVEVNVAATVETIDTAMDTMNNGTIVVMSSMGIFQPLSIDSLYMSIKRLLYDYASRVERRGGNRIVTVCPSLCRDKASAFALTYKQGAERIYKGLQTEQTFLPFPLHHYVALKMVRMLGLSCCIVRAKEKLN